MEIYQQNYRRLLQLLPRLHDMNGPAKLTAPGDNDVNIDVIDCHKHRLVLRMSRYLERLPAVTPNLLNYFNAMVD